MAARVKTGESISSAFEAQGGFPVVYTTTLLAGERSGNLEEVLQRFLDFQRVSLTFRKKLKASLIYPALLVVMVIGLFIFLITFVVPRFAQLYDQLGTQLPAIDDVPAGAGARMRSTMASMWLRCWRLVGYLVVSLDRRRTRARRAWTGCGSRLPLFGQGLAEVPGGAVFADAVDAADGRLAAGAVAGDGGAVDRFAADCEGGVIVGGDGARRQGAVGRAWRRRRCFRSWRSR